MPKPIHQTKKRLEWEKRRAEMPFLDPPFASSEILRSTMDRCGCISTPCTSTLIYSLIDLPMFICAGSWCASHCSVVSQNLQVAP